jgi:hypothetical protein
VVVEDPVVVVATGAEVGGPDVDVGSVEVVPLPVVQATTRIKVRRESFLIPV